MASFPNTSGPNTSGSTTNKLGCWFARLLDRKQSEVADLPTHFSARAQTALDSTGSSTPRGSLTREGMTLADLKPGECGYIHHLAGSTKGRLRLLEMGLTPGIHIQVTRVAAFGGPLDVHVRGYQLSIRREEAALVWLGSEARVVHEIEEAGVASLLQADSINGSFESSLTPSPEQAEQEDLG